VFICIINYIEYFVCVSLCVYWFEMCLRWNFNLRVWITLKQRPRGGNHFQSPTSSWRAICYTKSLVPLCVCVCVCETSATVFWDTSSTRIIHRNILVAVNLVNGRPSHRSSLLWCSYLRIVWRVYPTRWKWIDQSNSDESRRFVPWDSVNIQCYHS